MRTTTAICQHLSGHLCPHRVTYILLDCCASAMSNLLQSPTEPDSETWICAQCKVDFEHSHQLESRAKTTRHKAYRCSKDKTCNSLFISRTSWNRHERKHRAQKAHICPRCPASFHRSDHLQGHVRTCRGRRRRPRTPPRVQPTCPGLSHAKSQFEPMEFGTTMFDKSVPRNMMDTQHDVPSTIDTPDTRPGALDFTAVIENFDWADWLNWEHSLQTEEVPSVALTAPEPPKPVDKVDLQTTVMASCARSDTVHSEAQCVRHSWEWIRERRYGPQTYSTQPSKSDDVAATQSNTIDEPNDHQPRSKIAKFFSKLKAYIKAPFRRHKR